MGSAPRTEPPLPHAETPSHKAAHAPPPPHQSAPRMEPPLLHAEDSLKLTLAHAPPLTHQSSFSVTSAAVIALGKSCLFAKTRRTASRISSSFSILLSSSFASSTRSRSLLSTTKIKPCVFW